MATNVVITESETSDEPKESEWQGKVIELAESNGRLSEQVTTMQAELSEAMIRLSSLEADREATRAEVNRLATLLAEMMIEEAETETEAETEAETETTIVEVPDETETMANPETLPVKPKPPAWKTFLLGKPRNENTTSGNE